MKLNVISCKGEGKLKPTPILFVHGAWHGAWCWDENFMSYFAKHGYNSYALDLRGHGESPGNVYGKSIADYVADVTQVINDDIRQEPILVGHSMGGLVVQKYLETYSAKVAVLLASVPVGGATRAAIRIFLRHPWPFLKAIITLRLYPIIATKSLCHEAFFSKNIAPEKLEKYCNLMQDESFLAFIDMILRLPKPNKIKVPVLILGAENDNIFSRDEIEATSVRYNIKAEIFPKMAHDMMLEICWKCVANRIIEWLESQRL